MPQVQQKPIIHGRDHMAGGADPIPGMGTGGGGIDFDTYPQDGGWLYIETTDESEAGGSPNSYGLDIRDTSTGGIGIRTAGRFNIISSAGNIGIEADDGTVQIDSLGAGHSIFLHAQSDAGISIQSNGTGNVDIRAVDALCRVGSQGTDGLMLWCDSGPIHAHIAPGETFTIWGAIASPPFEEKILEVRDDGSGVFSFHLLSGASWVADL